MTNENKNNTSSTETTGINRQFFEGLIKNSSLPEEDKKKIGEFNKDFKNDTVGEVLKTGEKDKIKGYDKLNVKDLPEDWELKLARLKELESHEADYLQKKTELQGWTDTFGEKKPAKVQEEINGLEQKLTKTEEEAKTKIQNLENDLEKSVQESQNILKSLGARIQELETKLNEWSSFFGDRELVAVQEELEALRKRPDANISTEDFYNDYARRKSLETSQLENEELAKQKEKVEKHKEKNKKLWFAINKFLKEERIRRYVLSKPVLTIKQAREAIAELLEETEREWDYYLQGITTDQNFSLDLSLWEKDKETQARQILGWIKEARNTLDYEKLSERWNEGTKYNEEHDFDGSLYLLSEWLKVKDFEPPVSQ